MGINNTTLSKLQPTKPINNRQEYVCPNDCIKPPKILHLQKPPLQRGFIEIGPLKSIPDSVRLNPINNLTHFYFNHLSSTYKVEENKGINGKGARPIDICLAKYALAVANEMDVAGCCYTGVKHTLWNAGVINDYGDMPKGSAHDSVKYFDENPKKFEKVNVKKEDLQKLPAGMIIVYTKDGKDGHIAITNGNGQEMSDCTDNMAWLDKEGDDAKFYVYRLTDNWEYDKETKKLKFNG